MCALDMMSVTYVLVGKYDLCTMRMQNVGQVRSVGVISDVCDVFDVFDVFGLTGIHITNEVTLPATRVSFDQL